MNAIDPLPESAPTTPDPSAAAPAVTPAEPLDEDLDGSSRGNGKVARLPKATCDQISRWIQDSLSYPAIIEKLGEVGKDLIPNNLSQWKKRGYQYSDHAPLGWARSGPAFQGLRAHFGAPKPRSGKHLLALFGPHFCLFYTPTQVDFYP